ncbi:hypothetical protein ACWDRB_59125 [Nonomuraea sp. NPDC003707]
MTVSRAPSVSAWALFTASIGTAGHHAHQAARAGAAGRRAISRTRDVPKASSAPPIWSDLCRDSAGENRCTARKYASASGG